MLYDPKYKDKKTEEEQESLDSILVPEFDEDEDYLNSLDLNLPAENYDE